MRKRVREVKKKEAEKEVIKYMRLEGRQAEMQTKHESYSTTFQPRTILMT